MKPIFTTEQLTASLWASSLIEPVLREVTSFDAKQLYQDIINALPNDPYASDIRSRPLSPRWSEEPSGLLLQNGKVYVPDLNDLQLRVLRYRHDHLLAGHYGVNKTLALVRREFS